MMLLWGVRDSSCFCSSSLYPPPVISSYVRVFIVLSSLSAWALGGDRNDSLFFFSFLVVRYRVERGEKGITVIPLFFSPLSSLLYLFQSIVVSLVPLFLLTLSCLILLLRFFLVVYLPACMAIFGWR